MINIKAKGRHVMFGDSLPDVATFLATHFPTWGSTNYSKRNTATRQWDLNVGYDGAWKLANEGWTQGAADLAVAIAALEPDATIPELKFGLAGERPDVPRFLGGSPDCMVTRGKRTSPKPIVHLVVNNSVSGSVDAKAITNYGAALTAVIDQLENAGRRVELDVANVVTVGGVRVVFGWKVKQAQDHLDLSAVAFSIQHPAAFRRIGFAMIERSTATATMTYGYPGTLLAEELPLINADGAHILPGVGLSYGVDPKAAQQLAIRQVNAAVGEELISAA